MTSGFLMCAGLQPEHVRVSGKVICEPQPHTSLMCCCPDEYFVLLKDESNERSPEEVVEEVMEEVMKEVVEERTVQVVHVYLNTWLV